MMLPFLSLESPQVQPLPVLEQVLPQEEEEQVEEPSLG
jgi:hypothetical protein